MRQTPALAGIAVAAVEVQRLAVVVRFGGVARDHGVAPVGDRQVGVGSRATAVARRELDQPLDGALDGRGQRGGRGRGPVADLVEEHGEGVLAVAGSAPSSGPYQATPTPSPFSRSERSSLSKLCRMSECAGSVKSALMRNAGPW